MLQIIRESSSVYKICLSLSATADIGSALFLLKLELHHWICFIPVTANKPSCTVQIMVCIKLFFRPFKGHAV